MDARATQAAPCASGSDPSWWLFSPEVDVAAFFGSALLSLVLLAFGWQAGLLDRAMPEWTWIATVLLIDVAHVYATVFRVYTDPQELARAPWRYALAPLAALALGVTLYATTGPTGFWRVLAYLAVFHFVRQQQGWVALYRARRGERDRLGAYVDTLAIYAATVYPLIEWHARLPRRFDWFSEGDFCTVLQGDTIVVAVAHAIYVAALSLYAARAAWRSARGESNPGKDMVVATTAICWYVGIVAFDSDYAFTVTNVLIHGIPYLVLVYFYGRYREQHAPRPPVYAVFRRGPLVFVAILWLIAYAEELLWDRAVWHTHPALFGGAWHPGDDALTLLVPLLALPQAVHYLLDGVVWKRHSGPFMRHLVGGASAAGPAQS